jgi:protoheme IX farnesyltransferase
MGLNQIHTVSEITFVTKLKACVALMKLRLSSLVVMSAFFGFILADGEVLSINFIYLIVGGVFVTGAANGFNQVIEADSDELMSRTQNRPLPSKILTKIEASIFCSITGALGTYFLFLINFNCFLLGILAMSLYALLYTPLKKLTPFAVFVGAIPGSIPPLLGYIAVSNSFDLPAGVLFIVQFFWQFPHFWALAWKLDEDYNKAGFRLLPSGRRDKKSAFQIMLYSAFLVPVSMLPWAAQMTGVWSMITAVVISLVMYYPSVKLYFTLENKYATQLMFMSFFYLPILLTLYCFNQI